ESLVRAHAVPVIGPMGRKRGHPGPRRLPRRRRDRPGRVPPAQRHAVPPYRKPAAPPVWRLGRHPATGRLRRRRPDGPCRLPALDEGLVHADAVPVIGPMGRKRGHPSAVIPASPRTALSLAIATSPSATGIEAGWWAAAGPYREHWSPATA